MTRANSIAPAGARKPLKATKTENPYPHFPLFVHSTRRWAKKILGKQHYFGPWDDPDKALQNYFDQTLDNVLHGTAVHETPSPPTKCDTHFIVPVRKDFHPPFSSPVRKK